MIELPVKDLYITVMFIGAFNHMDYSFDTFSNMSAFVEGLKYAFHRDNPSEYMKRYGFGNFPMDYLQASNAYTQSEYSKYLNGVSEADYYYGFDLV